jgi:hypothetical protein
MGGVEGSGARAQPLVPNRRAGPARINNLRCDGNFIKSQTTFITLFPLFVLLLLLLSVLLLLLLLLLVLLLSLCFC